MKRHPRDGKPLTVNSTNLCSSISHHSSASSYSPAGPNTLMCLVWYKDWVSASSVPNMGITAVWYLALRTSQRAAVIGTLALKYLVGLSMRGPSTFCFPCGLTGRERFAKARKTQLGGAGNKLPFGEMEIYHIEQKATKKWKFIDGDKGQNNSRMEVIMFPPSPS